MSEIHLKDYYEQEREDFKLYLEKSKKTRLLIRTFNVLLGLSIVLMILILGFKIEVRRIYEPEFTLNYILPSTTFISFLFSLVALRISDRYMNKIKKMCGYEFINIPLIYIFESSLSLENYLEIPKDIYKSDFMKSLKKGLKIINDWDYGNIPFIIRDIENQIDFLKNDFEYVAKSLINSKNINERYTLLNILGYLCDFLYNPSLNTLNIFYSKTNKYKIEKPTTIKALKNKVNIFFENHPAISQILFTTLLAFITFLIGEKLNAEIITIAGWIFVVSIGSFTIFDKIKKWIS